MARFVRTPFVTSVLLVALAAPAWADRLFATTGQSSTTSTLLELDPTTGAVISTIGPVGYVVNGMTWDATTGTLYASTGFNDPTFRGLITIDVTTGAGTPIGAANWGTGDIVTNITTDSLGNMFGWTESSDNLVSIDKVTGVATVVGASGIGTGRNGLSFDGADVLWMVNSGGLTYTVDTVTGAATFTSSLGVTAHHGDFESVTNLYYGLDQAGIGTVPNVVVADLATNTIVTTLSPGVTDLHVLTFVPGPIADAGPDQTHECPAGPLSVTLDGSGSFDPNALPLTYTWTGPFDGGVATGVSPTVTFSTGPGVHVVTLVVNNGTQDSPPDTMTVTIQDTTPPTVTGSLLRTVLWPTYGGLLDVGLSSAVTDACDPAPTVTSIEVWSDEPDLGAPYSPDATLVGTTLRCRSERRVGAGFDGRVYLIVVRAQDATGNVAAGSVTCVVPLSLTVLNLNSVFAQAAAANATFQTTGLPPAGWTRIL
jgi:hypothetical protein